MAEAALPLLIGAAGLSAVTSISQGLQAQKIGNLNAESLQNEANATLQAADARADQQKLETRRLLGDTSASFGASGVDPSQGSPLSVLSDQAAQGELTRRLTLWQGQNQASSLNQQGEMQRYQGYQAFQSGLLKAGSTLLSAGFAGSQIPASGGAPVAGAPYQGFVGSVGSYTPYQF